MDTATGICPNRIEDYALIGNCETVPLVGRDGSIDWMCLPRFDSAACFAALLGGSEKGRWLIAPSVEAIRVHRAYHGHTLVLDTVFETDSGAVCVRDFMSRRDRITDLFRVVRGLTGSVPVRTELRVRFDYGSAVPWVSRLPDGRLQFASGPDRATLDASVTLRGVDMCTVGEFRISAGEEVYFSFSWTPSYRAPPSAVQPGDALLKAESFWGEWMRKYNSTDEWGDAVPRSLLTLKALTHRATGGIVAAASMSLPEKLGGSRNWDYRYCWLRDATFALYAFIGAGHLAEARAWREWLIRAIGGNPGQLQIMYGVSGERRLREYEAGWLPGYERSVPVRIGNAAAGQLQLDVYGEVLDALYVARKAGLAAEGASWSLERALVTHLETIWRRPDEGIWEVRGGRKQFTYSKVMTWVAFDRAVRSVEEFGLEGPLVHWRSIRDAIHQEVCEHGFNAGRNSFVQSYEGAALDASLLLLPLVGFLPADDPRIRGTVAAIERNLLRDGLVLRYLSDESMEGLPPGEGVFLACSFWLVDNYVLQGRRQEARALFQRLLSLRNDVGLLAEQYDSETKRQLGNFPQALSHLALINTARNLSGNGPAHDRCSRTPVRSRSRKETSPLAAGRRSKLNASETPARASFRAL
jgi:GH15 family glucan-1,4-alpha-glucosidase